MFFTISPDISYDSSRGGLSTFLARHVRLANAGVFLHVEDRGPKHNAAMEGRFAIDSAAAGAETDEICGLVRRAYRNRIAKPQSASTAQSAQPV